MMSSSRKKKRKIWRRGKDDGVSSGSILNQAKPAVQIQSTVHDRILKYMLRNGGDNLKAEIEKELKAVKQDPQIEASKEFVPSRLPFQGLGAKPTISHESIHRARNKYKAQHATPAERKLLAPVREQKASLQKRRKANDSSSEESEDQSEEGRSSMF